MKEMMNFNHHIRPSQDLMSLTCNTPVDIKMFLVWKNQHGKSQVHMMECAFLGRKGLFDCYCPVRLASVTVSLLILRLVNLYEFLG